MLKDWRSIVIDKVYASLSFFDLNRICIVDTDGLFIEEQSLLYKKYWEDALTGKISVASDVRFSKERNAILIYFACPVKDKNNKTFGVVVSRFPVDKLYEIIIHTAGLTAFEESIGIDLVSQDGLVLYSNHNRASMLKDRVHDWAI